MSNYEIYISQQTREVEKCRFNVGPASATPAQHQIEIGSTTRICNEIALRSALRPTHYYIVSQDCISSSALSE